MPSPFSSEGSVADARTLAEILKIPFKTIPISDVYNQYLKTLPLEGVAKENIQARIRGTMLMALSNQDGSLLLSTGNKSEMSVGYCTLYGDMNGGLSVISDIPKTMVYELARYIGGIPESTMTKPPSAELRPDQKDQDTLPPYDILDAILQSYIEEGRSKKEIIAKGFDPKTVEWVITAIRRNEYKRRQAAPGIKVTSKAFGIGRRMPLAARLEY